jgi:rhodanese-related sulfurtransferase
MTQRLALPRLTLQRRALPLLLAGAALAPRPAEAWLWRRGMPDPADAATTLDAVERAVTRLIPVPEITPREIAPQLAQMRLFDVREPEEFALSRLPGAIRLDPGLPAAAFRAAHGAQVAGARVVFYCAVGWRSGKMLERVQATIASAAPAALYNLRGGLFRWRAEGLPLEGAAEVHHYDAAWGQLLRRTLGG